VRQAAPRKTIGQALADLRAEFPDADIKESKVRFLEAEGLVEPERTPSGYRKYSTEDMERLRYIIRMQREHYLPLKVIKEHLEAMDRGL
jgi:DNA-binding transcriptional MerR regulator